MDLMQNFIDKFGLSLEEICFLFYGKFKKRDSSSESTQSWGHTIA